MITLHDKEYRLNASCTRIKTNNCEWGIAFLTMAMEGDWQAYDSELLSYDYGYNGIESLEARQLNPATYRLLDPGIGRWYQIDPAAESFYDLSPYVSMGNNPVVMVDPDGDFIVAALVGAAVGVLANGIVNSVNGNPFFQGWGMSTVMGAVGGAMGYGISSSGMFSNIGAQALQGLASAASSYLPGYSVPLGNSGFTLNINPALAFGSQGFNLAASVGLSYAEEGFAMGISITGGYTKMSLGNNMVKDFIGSVGGGFYVGDAENGFGLYTNFTFGGGIGQQVAGIKGSVGGFSFGYENDNAPFEDLGLGILNDGGDRWRTAAVSIGYGRVDVRLNLFTGAPTGKPTEPSPGYPFGYHTGDADDFRLGALSIGYRGYRLGWNSEGIRHLFQNKIAHTIIKPQPYFKNLGGRGSLYTSTTTHENLYSLWTF